MYKTLHVMRDLKALGTEKFQKKSGIELSIFRCWYLRSHPSPIVRKHEVSKFGSNLSIF